MLKIHNYHESQCLQNWGEVTVNGEKISLVAARVSPYPHNTWWLGWQRAIEQTELAPFISFESDGEVTVSVKRNKEVNEVVVRPLSKKVEVKKDGEFFVFTLKKQGSYTFETDGFNEALHIFFNPVRDFFAEAQAERDEDHIIRFAPGVWEAGKVIVPSHTTVVVEAGAVVYGSLITSFSEDVKMCGYGIVDDGHEERSDWAALFVNADKNLADEKLVAKYVNENAGGGNVRLYCSKNCSVEGIILRDSMLFSLIPSQCENLVIDNVKSIGMWRFNSDGFDIFNCNGVVIKNCFLRNFDDSIVIKGMLGWDDKNNENIEVFDNVIWNDWGSALEIGAETNAPEYKNITFKNCDVIHGTHVAMRIHHHNRADIHDIHYENIRLEVSKYDLPVTIMENRYAPYTGVANTCHPALFTFIVCPDGLYGRKVENGPIHDVTVKNCEILNPDNVELTKNYEIRGGDENTLVSNVTIENTLHNGKPFDVTPYIDKNEFVKNIIIK